LLPQSSKIFLEEEEESNSNEENNLNIKSSQRDKEIEIFCDVLPKEQLKFFFTDRKKQY